jgi:hypothetical protein
MGSLYRFTKTGQEPQIVALQALAGLASERFERRFGDLVKELRT